MESLLQGLGIGIGLTLMVGPITLTIIDASLADGWRAGLATAVAMWLSDLGFIAVGYYGGQEVVSKFSFVHMEGWMNFVAGGILLLIGIVLWFLRHRHIDLTVAPSAGHLLAHAVRGFLVNTSSPFTLVFWPTIIVSIVLGQEMDMQRSALFFTGIMLMLITGDVMKSLFANWIRQQISDQYMRVTRSVIAWVFIVGGVVMIGKGLIN